jgi:proteasome lid subunit RPN8/RPN11
MPVLIRNSDLQFIMSHAKSTYPEECCGFLLGLDSRVRSVERIVSVQNVNQDSRRNRYNIDPKDLIRADEEARRSNMSLIGIYHSHPDAPAQPSQFDLEHAWPWYTYLLLSVENGQPKDIAAWNLSEDRSAFHLDDLKVTGDE